MAGTDRTGSIDPDTPGPGERSSPKALRILVLVALGGVLGATARHLLSELFGHGERSFPIATFLVNTVGAFLLGILVIVVDEFPRRRELRPFLATGVIGAFTTFSAFAMEVVLLIDLGRFVVAATYLAATLVVGIGAAWAGAAGARSAVVARTGTGR